LRKLRVGFRAFRGFHPQDVAAVQLEGGAEVVERQLVIEQGLVDGGGLRACSGGRIEAVLIGIDRDGEAWVFDSQGFHEALVGDEALALEQLVDGLRHFLLARRGAIHGLDHLALQAVECIFKVVEIDVAVVADSECAV